MNPSMHLPNSHFIDAILSKIVKLSCIPRRNVGLRYGSTYYCPSIVIIFSSKKIFSLDLHVEVKFCLFCGKLIQKSAVACNKQWNN